MISLEQMFNSLTIDIIIYILICILCSKSKRLFVEYSLIDLGKISKAYGEIKFRKISVYLNKNYLKFSNPVARMSSWDSDSYLHEGEYLHCYCLPSIPVKRCI